MRSPTAVDAVAAEVRHGHSRGQLLQKLTGAVLVLVAAWIVLDRWVLAGAPEPHPGVRMTTWKRVRDLPPDPTDGLAMQRATVRTARKYYGPAPSAEDLARCQASGMCDAFYDYLNPECKSRVDSGVAELDEVLDQIADACDEEIEVAKGAIRGTDLEFVRRSDQQAEGNPQAMRQFLALAKAAGDICVSDSHDGGLCTYRISRSSHPQVFELRRQDADLNEIRRQKLHELIADLIAREGISVLDVGAIDRVWAETLAHARR